MRLTSAGSLREDRDDQSRSVDYWNFESLIEVALLNRAEIVVDNDTARSETWINAHHVYADPQRNDGRLPIAGLRYQDRWVRTDDGWLVEHRKAFTDWRAWMDPRGPTYVAGVHQ